MNALALTPVDVPVYRKVWPDFAEMVGINSRPAAYDAASKLPVGVRVKVGNRLRINLSRLQQWLDQGGDLAHCAS